MSSSASDSDDALQKTINIAHAKALKLKRKRAQETSQKEKQELAQGTSENAMYCGMRLMDLLVSVRKQFGSDNEENDGPSEESDSETEDEDGDEFGAATDVALLKTLALIQKKDPSIYDTTTNVFGGRCPYSSLLVVALMPSWFPQRWRSRSQQLHRRSDPRKRYYSSSS